MIAVGDIKEWLKPGHWPKLSKLLDDKHIAALLAKRASHKEHPMLHILRSADPSGTRSQGHADLVLLNTEWAVGAILNRGSEAFRDWLVERMSSLCAEDDLANVAAALGEIRAGGFLADSGLVVDPVRRTRKKTPDFRISLSSGPIFVEAHTRNLPEPEARALKDFNDCSLPASGSTGGVREHVVHLAGKRKPNETNVENLAQKFAGTKPCAAQVSGEHPAILWLDLQDEDAWIMGTRYAEPVYIGGRDGDFYTPGLWHAFYGLKGTPMLEGHSMERRSWGASVLMRFDGTFTQHKAWSAVVLAMASATVVFENHWACRRLPADFWGTSYEALPLGLRVVVA